MSRINRSKHTSQLYNRLKEARGFSIGETMIAVLIMLLASSGMVAGIQFVTAEYTKSMIASEKEVLYSTIQSSVTNELSYMTEVLTVSDVDGGLGDDYKKLVTYDSRFLDGTSHRFTPGISEQAGEIKITGGGTDYPLVPSGAYTYDMKAAMDVFCHYSGGKIDSFRVHLRIVRNSETLQDGFFDVEPLNELR